MIKVDENVSNFDVDCCLDRNVRVDRAGEIELLCKTYLKIKVNKVTYDFSDAGDDGV